ncbi:glycosyltransferase involved in cell wall biosynthesis [Granulicella aggregans]|uniref:Glycosyltransferase involved in cell wall biosynthesis n=1 Tax=Granulicella aggregans TaxID=474949 RepID=A0A7W7ZHA0_9BACT|nr:glycosyltransferase [Granulicella aggregans]MBB5059872.1 glycosyltransferase involved in cell wall biosynthesis [Granulicella aggregans]
MPTVSVVIPTRNRPAMALRAIDSVLAQTYQDLEVVVIIDGPDPATIAALEAAPNSRVRFAQMPSSVGGAEARNQGINRATGEWVALLDDDDEWMPTKLEKQMELALANPKPSLVVTRYFDQRPNATLIQPGSPPPTDPEQTQISEYLFMNTSWLGFRRGFVQTSTWLAPRSAFLEVPFTKGLPRNQETDWLLRAVPRLKLPIFTVWEPLAIFHNEMTKGRITSVTDWRDTLNWSLGKGLFTPRALFFFIAFVCGPTAKAQNEPLGVFFEVARAAFKFGRPSLKGIWLLFAGWFVFPYGRFGLRTRLQNFMNLRRPAEGRAK